MRYIFLPHQYRQRFTHTLPIGDFHFGNSLVYAENFPKEGTKDISRLTDVRTNVKTKRIRNQGAMPNEFALEQNRTNPFSMRILISFKLSAFSRMRSEMFDLSGRKVEMLVDEEQDKSECTISFNAAIYHPEFTTIN